MQVIRIFLAVVMLTFFQLDASAANRYWVSILGGNWNSTLSWASSSGGLNGASVPGVNDVAIFDGGSLLGLRVGNCTVNTTVNIAGLVIAAKYTGTITQNNPMNISGAAALGGGTFAGESDDITIGGTFTLSATDFTSTSGILELRGDAAFTGGSFSHNNGWVRFNGASSQTISGTSPVFYALEFVGTGHAYTLSSSGNIGVLSSLNLSGTSSYTLTAGALDVSGDIALTNTSAGDGGTSTINIMGSGNQTISSALAINQSTLPSVRINKTGGTLRFPGMITVMGNWTYSAGTLDVSSNNSTVAFDNSLDITGSHTLNNVLFEGDNNWTFTLASGTVLTVAGTLSTTGASNIFINAALAGATAIQAQGDILISNTGTAGGGQAAILINGAGNQTFSGTAAASEGLLPYINIQKASGTLTLGGTISESRDWTYTSGTVDPAASTVVFGGNNLSLTSAGMRFYNVAFAANTSTLTNNLSVNNNLSINGSGILAPGSNNIDLAGNWTGRGTAGFTESASTVNFNGTAQQLIGSAGGEDFANLTLNNSGAGIKLLNNITVANTLTMGSGNIDLNSNTLMLGLSPAATGTLVRTSGTVINGGSLVRWFNTGLIPSGSAAGLFPVGTAADYRPIFLSAPVSGPSTGGSVAVTYNDASTNSLVSIPDLPFTISLRKDLNWTMSTAGLAGGVYELQIQGTNYGLIGNLGDLRISLVNSVVGSPGTNTGTVANPAVNRTGLSAADLNHTFYLGSVNPVVTPLPVVLLSFSANLIAGQVDIQWETATETQTKYFAVLRSRDAVTWERLIRVPGKNNAGNNAHYEIFDAHPYPGTSYYRLKNTDVDGHTYLSPIRTIAETESGQAFSVNPNPASGFLLLQSPGNAVFSVSIFNTAGAMVQFSSGHRSPDRLDISQIPAGVYFVRVLAGGISQTKTIVINR